MLSDCTHIISNTQIKDIFQCPRTLCNSKNISYTCIFIIINQSKLDSSLLHFTFSYVTWHSDHSFILLRSIKLYSRMLKYFSIHLKNLIQLKKHRNKKIWNGNKWSSWWEDNAGNFTVKGVHLSLQA